VEKRGDDSGHTHRTKPATDLKQVGVKKKKIQDRRNKFGKKATRLKKKRLDHSPNKEKETKRIPFVECLEEEGW